jgi:sulfotransferase family protein
VVRRQVRSMVLQYARGWFRNHLHRLQLVARPTYARLRWHTEDRVCRGGRLRPRRSQTSVLFYTGYKCASVFLSEQLAQLARAHGLMHVDYCSYLANRSLSEWDYLRGASFVRRAFAPRGHYFGPIRWYRAVPELVRYRTILVLRDPRDALTSNYYSLAFSHSVMNQELLDRRRQVSGVGVDEFVLAQAENVRLEYNRLVVSLLNPKAESVLFARYEDMVVDYGGWLTDVARHLQLDRCPALLEHLIASADFSVKRENVLAHKRQVKPGDHREKLNGSTIRALDEKFAPVLETLGYRPGWSSDRVPR